jgi:hypothetical protein
MRNLASAKAASDAKRKVNIFAPWQADQSDHKVSIMYIPFINEDKHDDPAIITTVLFFAEEQDSWLSNVYYI